MRQIKFKAWHNIEEMLCEVTTLTDEGAFLKGVKKGKDQIILYDRCIVEAPKDGRFCYKDEFQLLISIDGGQFENCELCDL